MKKLITLLISLISLQSLAMEEPKQRYYYIINNSGAAIHIRVRVGPENGLSRLLPFNKPEIMINNETIFVKDGEILIVNLSQLQNQLPLRIRLWPTTYIPSEDINPHTGRSITTSQKNSENSLDAYTVSREDFNKLETLPHSIVSLHILGRDHKQFGGDLNYNKPQDREIIKNIPGLVETIQEVENVSLNIEKEKPYLKLYPEPYRLRTESKQYK